jgi:hypothetical protein
MKRLAALLFLLVLGGCVSVARIDAGNRPVGERLQVTIDGAWNRIDAPGMGPAETWTMEGLPIDQLLLYSGIKDGQAVHALPSGSKYKVFAFRADMRPDEIAALFEGTFTRDGSRFTLIKLEPAPFGGVKGFRFEYSLTRKVDNVVLSGLAYGAVSKGELFAIIYMAPQRAFFPRHAARVAQLSQSARIAEK